jgi:hypothetical protein
MVNESRCHAAPWWQAWKWWRDVTDVTWWGVALYKMHWMLWCDLCTTFNRSRTNSHREHHKWMGTRQGTHSADKIGAIETQPHFWASPWFIYSGLKHNILAFWLGSIPGTFGKVLVVIILFKYTLIKIYVNFFQ